MIDGVDCKFNSQSTDLSHVARQRRSIRWAAQNSKRSILGSGPHRNSSAVCAKVQGQNDPLWLKPAERYNLFFSDGRATMRNKPLNLLCVNLIWPKNISVECINTNVETFSRSMAFIEVSKLKNLDPQANVADQWVRFWN